MASQEEMVDRRSEDHLLVPYVRMPLGECLHVERIR